MITLFFLLFTVTVCNNLKASESPDGPKNEKQKIYRENFKIQFLEKEISRLEKELAETKLANFSSDTRNILLKMELTASQNNEKRLQDKIMLEKNNLKQAKKDLVPLREKNNGLQSEVNNLESEKTQLESFNKRLSSYLGGLAIAGGAEVFLYYTKKK